MKVEIHTQVWLCRQKHDNSIVIIWGTNRKSAMTLKRTVQDSITGRDGGKQFSWQRQGQV